MNKLLFSLLLLTLVASAYGQMQERVALRSLGERLVLTMWRRGRIGRFNEDLTIKVELYNVATGNLMGSFTGYFKDIYSLLALIDDKAPELF